MISDTQINDDDYGYNPSAQEQRGPAPKVLMPGVYKVQATVMPRKNDGEPVVFRDSRGTEWPVYVIPSIEVTEPFEEGGRFDVWHELSTIPRRFSEEDDFVSDGAVLLKAIDANEANAASSFKEAVSKLKELAENGRVEFAVSTGLTARDSDWAREQIANGNITDKKEIQKIWRKANLPTKTFLVKKGGKGVPSTYALRAKSPLSGRMVDAKVRIARFLPSDLNGVTFGVGQFPPKN